MNNSEINISSKNINMHDSTQIDENSPFYMKNQFATKQIEQNSKNRIRDINLLLEVSQEETEQFDKILDDLNEPNNKSSNKINSFYQSMNILNLSPNKNQSISFHSENLQSDESYHKIEEESTLSNLYFKKSDNKSFEAHKQELNKFCHSDIEEEEDPNLMSDHEIQNIINKKMELLNMYNTMLVQRDNNTFEFRYFVFIF